MEDLHQIATEPKMSGEPFRMQGHFDIYHLYIHFSDISLVWITRQQQRFLREGVTKFSHGPTFTVSSKNTNISFQTEFLLRRATIRGGGVARGHILSLLIILAVFFAASIS